MGNKITKYCVILLLLLLLSSCYHGCLLVFCASDGWYAQQAREKFIRLSPEGRKKQIEFCVSYYKKMIDLVPNQKKVCNSWNCSLGKEDLEEKMNSCTLSEESTPQEQERLKHKDYWKYKIRSWYYGIWD